MGVKEVTKAAPIERDPARANGINQVPSETASFMALESLECCLCEIRIALVKYFHMEIGEGAGERES